jgi:hypothetical protein
VTRGARVAAADRRLPGDRGVTRRALVAAAAATALVRPSAAAAAIGARDSATVVRLIAREEAAALAYRGQARPSLFALAAHEAGHARALRAHLAALGHEPPPAATLDAAARCLGDARGDALLEAAIALETSLLAAYRDALVALVEPSILRTAATIAAAHAQHRALLRLAAGRDPLG